MRVFQTSAHATTSLTVRDPIAQVYPLGWRRTQDLRVQSGGVQVPPHDKLPSYTCKDCLRTHPPTSPHYTNAHRLNSYDGRQSLIRSFPSKVGVRRRHL